MFVLNCPDGPLELREAYGFTRQEVSRIGTDLGVHVAALCSAWSNVHGRV